MKNIGDQMRGKHTGTHADKAVETGKRFPHFTLRIDQWRFNYHLSIGIEKNSLFKETSHSGGDIAVGEDKREKGDMSHRI